MDFHRCNSLKFLKLQKPDANNLLLEPFLLVPVNIGHAYYCAHQKAHR